MEAGFPPVPRGLISVTGGGGKTSLISRLAETLRARGSVIVATSARVYPPEGIGLYTGSDPDAVRGILQETGILCVGTPAESGKLAASAVPFALLKSLADYVLNEADGSRGLPLKAHLPHEPAVPAETDLLIRVAGLDGIGRPVRDAVHRPERFAEICGCAPEAAVTPDMLRRVILAEGVPDLLFLNKTDLCPGWEETARYLRSGLPCAVAAGSLKNGVMGCLF